MICVFNQCCFFSTLYIFRSKAALKRHIMQNIAEDMQNVAGQSKCIDIEIAA